MLQADGPDPAPTVRQALRDWVASRSDGTDAASDGLDAVPLFEQRVLTSLHLPELILLIERLRGAPVDIDELTAADLRTIDAIVDRFFDREGAR